ncbi:hypothetical protein T492DRAFT_915817 [Pavlovales sp. CCMP2436]|nr:hypothetical protein T492DRAFT_915817 [Pavlovales sp. CCMP2436]
MADFESSQMQPEVEALVSSLARPPAPASTHAEPANRPSRHPAQALRWVFGFNKDVAGGVHSLIDEYRTVRARPSPAPAIRAHAARLGDAIFYIASNNGVIYDTVNKTQKLLQGHANLISACCVSEDKRWIVTADVGPDPMLVVWDSYSALAAKTIARPHLAGVQAMDISADGKQIVTLSREAGGGEPQVISVWHWLAEGDGAAMSAETVRFAPDDASELISNGDKRVVFWSVDEEGLQFYSPPVAQRDFKQPVGDFTVSLALPGTGRAISATTDGTTNINTNTNHGGIYRVGFTQ